MKKFICLLCVALAGAVSCQLIDETQNYEGPITLDRVVTSVNIDYLYEPLTALEGLLEVRQFIDSGRSDVVKDYRDGYEVEQIGGFFYRDRGKNGETPWWRYDPYGSQGLMLRFDNKGENSWSITPVLESDHFTLLVTLEKPEERTVDGATLEVEGMRPDLKGPHNVKFHSLSPLRCKWVRSEAFLDSRALLLEGTIHYDFCKGEEIIESQDREFHF